MNDKVSAVAVFCGSSSGTQAIYDEKARETGRLLAERGIRLVYGGGRVGLMGAVADAALAAGGEVVGVMPEALVEREIAHKSLSHLHVVGSMHERKALMAELSDAFVALPGGAGTLEELFEQWTWAQLGVHAKPCGLLNVAGYFDPLLAMAQHMSGEGFMRREYLDMLVVAQTPAEILHGFAHYVAPAKKWREVPAP
ncbi:TIGR00730 family Rossman fold protein [Rhodocyclus tenuis]|uniref:Cytokinin riboside 5'-monophosphate phosphoribohydrolase n=2 Tax=Rhodocyclus TaxID=1064 RepID=A0A6L5JTQ3_RHOTE|nr:TIGR00730 family Rossman fold protein [Rhodocyclus gracilis]MQY50212.1 TIGR00730 family Rossman fold protein [Rhodocyclus gracilis]MRD71890.1 TIGR00730 family Rossman fold protein [Rhodocyclus gracilis]NJA87670.1 TIGR00730 family Rossman fold protein [Rhodocyclus gracilis]